MIKKTNRNSKSGLRLSKIPWEFIALIVSLAVIVGVLLSLNLDQPLFAL